MAEQYILRWHYHESTLCKNLPFLLESDILTDCTISVSSKNYKAHKLILAICSPYFLQLFQKTNPLEFPIIILHNSNAEDVEAILSYIYRGQCLVTNEQLPSLLSLAKTLKIQGLCNMKINDVIIRSAAIDYDNELMINTCKKEEGSDYTNVCTEYLTHISNDDIKNEYSNFATAVNISDYDLQNDIKSEAVKQELLSYGALECQSKKSARDVSEICKCFICGKYLSNQYNLRVHIETHKDAYYSCLSCPHVSKSRDALRKHVSYRHPEEYTSRKRKKPISL